MNNITLGDIVFDGTDVNINLIPSEQFRDELCRWNGFETETVKTLSLDMIYSFDKSYSVLSMLVDDGKGTVCEDGYSYPPTLIEEAEELVKEKYNVNDFSEFMCAIGFMQEYNMSREEAEEIIYFSRMLPYHFDTYSFGLAPGSYTSNQLLTLWEYSKEITRSQLWMISSINVLPDTAEMIGDLFKKGMTVEQLTSFLNDNGIQSIDQFQEQSDLEKELRNYLKKFNRPVSMFVATMDSESKTWMALGNTEENAKEAIRLEWNRCQAKMEQDGYKHAETFSSIEEMEEEYDINAYALEAGQAISW
jgi:hypothetical protein